MNIGMFTDTYFPQVSGVSTSVKLLRDELIKRGHKVILFTTTDPEAWPEEDVVRLPSIPFVSFEDRRIAYRGFDRCLKIARQYGLDIVHTHTEFSLGLVGKYIANRLKIPAIHTYHTMYENYTHYIMNGHLITQNHVKVLSKLFCSGADGLIAPSRLTHDTLREYGITNEIRVIPTGVEIPKLEENVRHTLRSELALNDAQTVLLSLSRLSKEKNIATVIQSFADVVNDYADAQLIIVGDGPERAILEQQAHDLQLQDSIQFVGQINHEDVWKYYQMADLYVNASMSESQGLTYLEAFANRLPIIAKRNDYLEGIMTDQCFGALVEEDADFGKAVTQYLQARQSGAIGSIDRTALYPLSVDFFAEQVEQYYADVIREQEEEDENFLEKMYGNFKETYSELFGGTKE